MNGLVLFVTLEMLEDRIDLCLASFFVLSDGMVLFNKNYKASLRKVCYAVVFLFNNVKGLSLLQGS